MVNTSSVMFCQVADGEVAYVVDVLMHVAKESTQPGKTGALRPPPAEGRGDMVVVPVLLSLVTAISAVRLYIPEDIRSRDSKMSVLKSLQVCQLFYYLNVGDWLLQVQVYF